MIELDPRQLLPPHCMVYRSYTRKDIHVDLSWLQMVVILMNAQFGLMRYLLRYENIPPTLKILLILYHDYPKLTLVQVAWLHLT